MMFVIFVLIFFCIVDFSILLAIGRNHAKISAGYLLAYGKELVASPPSEDQRNQLVASAEIFAGVCRAMLKYCSIDEKAAVWDRMLLPFLDEAVPVMPTTFISAFFDAIRYGIHHFPPRFFHSLLKWCVTKVQGEQKTSSFEWLLLEIHLNFLTLTF